MNAADRMVYRAQIFRQYPEVVHGFSTKCTGLGDSNMSLKYSSTETVLENRRHFCRILGILPEQLISAQQCHSGNVCPVTSTDLRSNAHLSRTDGMITNERGIFLMGLVADCALVLMFDPENCAVGLCHAGWRGTVRHITRTTVETMRACFGSSPGDCLALIGPSIGPCCYEIGEEVQALVLKNSAGHQQVLIEREGAVYLDLWTANKLQLVDAGVPAENIETSHICTACPSHEGVRLFHSYRREGVTCGRFAGVIGMR